MNKLPTTLIAIVMLLAMALSSMASETTTTTLSFQLLTGPATLTAPTVLSKKVALNTAELAKYQLLAGQSHGLVTREAAGASDSTKTALIVVGVVVVGAGIALLVWTHGGHGVPIGNVFAK